MVAGELGLPDGLCAVVAGELGLPAGLCLGRDGFTVVAGEWGLAVVTWELGSAVADGDAAGGRSAWTGVGPWTEAWVMVWSPVWFGRSDKPDDSAWPGAGL
ncbi:MAG: hypothetical protein LBJ61_00400 [Deltaproteobacteria bacterium]|nr:hypothetical protein [Deltaproteobacteria bacterium]